MDRHHSSNDTLSKPSANKQKLRNNLQNDVYQENQNSAKSNEESSVNLVTSLHKNTILVSLFGRKMQGLLDTGASISCIGKSVLEKFNNKQIRLTASNLKQIVGVGGEAHSILGEVKLPISISGLVFEHSFYVLDRVHHSIILGIDFMHSNKVVIDVARKNSSFSRRRSICCDCNLKKATIDHKNGHYST